MNTNIYTTGPGFASDIDRWKKN